MYSTQVGGLNTAEETLGTEKKKTRRHSLASQRVVRGSRFNTSEIASTALLSGDSAQLSTYLHVL